MYLRSVVTWVALAVLAVANGAVRNALISPRIGESGGHVVATGMLCALIILVTMSLIKWLGPESGNDAVKIGLLWLLMTVAFEFLAGHFLFGHPWSRLFADYNVAKGRVWVLVLIATFFAPLLSARFRKLV